MLYSKLLVGYVIVNKLETCIVSISLLGEKREGIGRKTGPWLLPERVTRTNHHHGYNNNYAVTLLYIKKSNQKGDRVHKHWMTSTKKHN